MTTLPTAALLRPAAVAVLHHARGNPALTLRQLGCLTILLHRADADLTLCTTAAEMATTVKESSNVLERVLRQLADHGYLARSLRWETGRIVKGALWSLKVPGAAAATDSPPLPPLLREAARHVLQHALHNPAVAMEHLGCLMVLLDRADDQLAMLTTTDALVQTVAEGSFLVHRLVRELVDHGYLTRTSRREQGRAVPDALWQLHTPGGQAAS